MKKGTLQNIGLGLFILALWSLACFLVPQWLGTNGLFGDVFVQHPVLKLSVYWVLMAHVTITAMSINFHRVHTHLAVKLSKWLDMLMQTHLWAISGITKLDWVSVHIYHHAYSDKPEDPHSPVQKGLAHVFFFGAYDYTKAKHWPDVLKIRKRLSANAYEQFIAKNALLGPVVLSILLLLAFGPLYGSIMALLNFSITPLFAVGGVNAIAHQFGYKNYDSKDGSRNIGFLFLLNWIICGELDHNNHHRYPKSPTFAHRWFEFDIGWVYVRMLRGLNLATVVGTIPSYQPDHATIDSQSDIAFV